ncbi:hypothetical protein Tco_0702529 [Tanacetum coccineum]|uniref:Uncharacterized protein n=1 Tax=Tanacetum coccineum TaxID=301880 RepID=A0ABQ4XW84_9ASTR
MKEQAYNMIKTKDSRTQRQSNLNKLKEARLKISSQEFEDHTLMEIVSLNYIFEHESSESAKAQAKPELGPRETLGIQQALGNPVITLRILRSPLKPDRVHICTISGVIRGTRND